MNPGELDYQRLRQLVKSLEKDVQRERDLRLLLEKRCRMYAALINRLTTRRQKKTAMATTPIASWPSQSIKRTGPDAPDLENVGNVKQSE